MTNMSVCTKTAELVAVMLTALLCRGVQATITPDPDDIKTFQVPSNGNLTAVLEAVQEYIANDSAGYFRLEVASGVFHHTHTALATFVNVSEVSIVGVKVGSTVIDCGGTAGFVFKGISNMTIANVTFYNCSSVQNSTTTNTTRPDSLSYVGFSVALYLLECSHVCMESVTISESQAVGLAMFNLRGSNMFIDIDFYDNTPPSSEVSGETVHGGGGVIVEFSYCRPGDVECNSTSIVEVSDASFEFSHCLFDSNVASSNGLGTAPIYPHGTEHAGFGKGGGMAVYFRGRAINNAVTLKNCLITGNKADSGGGLYVEFGDESQNNNFTFTSFEGGISRIGLSGQLCGTPGFNQSDKQSSGGGAKVVFMFYPPDPDLWPGYQANVTGNHVEFRGSYFTANMACWGGGVAFVSSRADPWTHQTNTIHFIDCTFLQNEAVVSAALDVSVLRPDTTSQSQLVIPVIDGCVFTKNMANTRSRDTTPNIAGYQFGSGAVYIDEVPTTFTGENHFTNNTGTGLVVSDAEVVVTRNTSLLFESNSGRRGGALTVSGSGFIVTYPGVLMSFVQNQALELGGAIYAEGHYGGRDFIYQEKCFIHYYQPTVHPKNWKAKFQFSNNTAAGKSTNSTIHVTSLLACVWPETDSANDDIEQTLCWPGWVYDGQNGSATNSCSKYVSTAPASFNNSASNRVYQMRVYPGHKKAIPVQMKDDYGEVISSVVFELTSNDIKVAKVAVTSMYITDNKLSVYGVTSSTAQRQFYLETLGPRVLSTMLQITLLPCPPGYAAVRNESDQNMVRKCKCAYSVYFTCTSSDMSASLRPGYCISYDSKNALCSGSHNITATHDNVVVVQCPATAKKGKPSPLPNTTSDLEQQFCHKFNRVGKFCSKCESGYAVDINDINNCVKCRRSQFRYGWFLYILTDILPITIFFVIVALFRISATSAPMYAFVFFAQITTVRYFHNQFPWLYGLAEEKNYEYLRPILLAPYCIWNLDFFVFTGGKICLSRNLTNLYILLLNYLIAFYPMLLILLSYVCIELHDRNFKLLVWLWRPFRACLIKFRRSWQPMTSIIDAFATFLMLSYTKITLITISLLTPAQPYHVYRDGRSVAGDLVFYFDPQYHYFRGAHLPLGLLALVVGVVFVLMPPVFLLLYPTRVFQRCLNRSGRSWQTLHTFADAFQGCFKNRTNNNRDYRYFAGFYLVLRIVIIVIYASELALTQQLLLQQLLSILAVLVFALVKPYKEPFYNKVDLALFSLLSVMNSLSFANYTHSCENKEQSTALFAINYAIAFLPLMYISVFVFYLLLKWRGIISPDSVIKELTAGGNEINITADYSSMQDVPDRLLHPQNYISNVPASVLSGNISTASSDDVSGVDRERGDGRVDHNRSQPSQRATEGSYFLKKVRNMRNYGSI